MFPSDLCLNILWRRLCRPVSSSPARSVRLNMPVIDKGRPMAVRLSVVAVVAVVAVLAKVLPKFLLDRTLYRVTGSKLALLLSLLLINGLSWWLQGGVI